VENSPPATDNAQCTTPDLYTGEPPQTSAKATWKRVQSDLAYAIGANVHRSWTARLTVTDANAHDVILSAPTRFIASKIRSEYFETLCRLWVKHDEVAPPRRVKLAGPIHNQDDPNAPIRPSTPRKRRVEEKLMTASSTAPLSKAHPSITPHTIQNSQSNHVNANSTGYSTVKSAGGQRFQFDNFITGPANQFAFSAVKQVAHQDHVTYNPIVVYGKNGSGSIFCLLSNLSAILSSLSEAQRAIASRLNSLKRLCVMLTF